MGLLLAFDDLSKAHENAAHIKKLNHEMKEVIMDAQKYNNRERLLGLPVTNVSIVLNNSVQNASNKCDWELNIACMSQI